MIAGRPHVRLPVMWWRRNVSIPGQLRSTSASRAIASVMSTPGTSHLVISVPCSLARFSDSSVRFAESNGPAAEPPHESRHFEFIIGAAALYWRAGPAALMQAQLDRLGAMTALADVTVGIHSAPRCPECGATTPSTSSTAPTRSPTSRRPPPRSHHQPGRHRSLPGSLQNPSNRSHWGDARRLITEANRAV